MNQKDYKAIAKINKRYKKWFANEEVHALYCELQADYFEREDKVLIEKKKKWDKGDNSMSIKELQDVFNREQFLKWCGVKDETKRL